MVILLKAAQKLRNLGRHNGTARREEYGRITLLQCHLCLTGQKYQLNAVKHGEKK